MSLHFLASLALGLVKGYASNQAPKPFNATEDIFAPVREELAYRSGRLSGAPGSTAAPFAAAHIAHDYRQNALNGRPQMTPLQVAARLGDVFLGGLLYEGAAKKSGVVAAIAAHSAHNVAIRLGQRLRRGKK